MTHAMMRRYKLFNFGQKLDEVTEPIPTPTGTQVLLRTSACGVCHSDIHMAAGYFDLGHGKTMDLSRGIQLPRVLGHEIAGRIVGVGSEAEGVEAGQNVVVYPWGGCGHCELCLSDREHLCNHPHVHGMTRDGGFSEYVLVEHPRYLIPFDPLPAPFAATLACAGLTAFSAIRKAGTTSDTQPLLIIGAGGVGSAAISLVQAMHGVRPVVADIDQGKRDAAVKAGALVALDPADENERKRVFKQFGGFCAAIDFVGAAATASYGLSMLAKGGRLILVGLFGGAIDLALPILPTRSIGLIGSYVGSLAEFKELMQLARDGHLTPTSLETRPLTQAQQSLDDLQAGRIKGRAVLLP